MIRKTKLTNSGMTLVELLVVIVILGLMMGVLARGLFQQGDAAKAKLNQAAALKLQQKIEQYRLEYNVYPSQLEDLLHPSDQVKGGGEVFVPLATEDELKDVWNFPFVYRSENNGRSYTLKSLGSDGIEGGEGANADFTVRPAG